MRVDDEKFKKASEYFNSKLSFEDFLKDNGLLEDSEINYTTINMKCPFHADSNPSLKIDTERNLYKCFSGGCTAGNLIKFMSEYDKIVLQGTKGYFGTLETLLRKDVEAQRVLGFNSIYEDSLDLNTLRRDGIKRLKISKSEPKNFLELSNYIRQFGTHKDKIEAIKLMQDNLSASVIYNMLFGKKDKLPNGSSVFNFAGVSLEDLLKED